jgi:hypothetical protein
MNLIVCNDAFVLHCCVAHVCSLNACILHYCFVHCILLESYFVASNEQFALKCSLHSDGQLCCTSSNKDFLTSLQSEALHHSYCCCWWWVDQLGYCWGQGYRLCFYLCPVKLSESVHLVKLAALVKLD